MALLLTGSGNAYASEDWCTYQSRSGEKESILFKMLGEQREIIQLRFKGPVADRYFTLNKIEHPAERFTYTEFAQRENSQSMLKIQARPDSKFVVVSNLGGNHYYYDEGKGESYVVCPEKIGK